MRKFMKKSILEIFQTMYEAHKNIKQFIEKKNFENANIILGDCQDIAIQIGEAIESSEGEGFVTVSYLEEYCEAVYEVSASISDNCNGNKAQKMLDKLLIKAENSVKNDIKVRLEILFCPYKASMWDSLESVWKAADEDPDCDAYVVPIPYYDRNPDHSFGEFHYEGGDYPDYVPIVHYEAYDFENRRPDVVYIHNPYDEDNYVTSVDPRFYSKELKKYTERLVYIPYFVVSDNVPEHFCETAGCLYADDVIVQSEQVKEKYIEVFKSSFAAMVGDRVSKFVALGSPKFDDLSNLRKDDFELPKEWADKIQGKKVVLYNTSVAAILNGDAQYLKKIRSVLEFFSKQENVVLWWRPHPLSTAVYDSMIHLLLGEYVKIIEQYKMSGIGIYDDTPDLHRAICFSDAYYGDRSSLVALYQFTGKPVMIQTKEICEYPNICIPSDFEALYNDGTNLWFSSMYINGLFKMNKESLKPEFVSYFNNESFSSNRLYTGITEYNGKLFFAPFAAAEIAVYNPKNNEMAKISFDQSRVGEFGSHFYDVVLWEHKLFFIPYGYNAVLCYNAENDEMTYCDDWVDEVRSSRFFDSSMGYFRNGVIVDNKLYLPCISGGKMVIIDVDTLKTEVVKITDKDLKTHGVCTDEKNLWIAPFDGAAVRWSIEDRSVTVIELPTENRSGTFGNIALINGKAWLFPYLYDEFVAVDTTTLKTEVVEIAKSPKTGKLFSGHYIMVHNNGRFLYTYEMQSEQLVIYDTIEKEVRREKVVINDKVENLLGNYISSIYMVPEKTERADEVNYIENSITNIVSLVKFITYHADIAMYEQMQKRRSELRKRTISNPDGTAGRKIHKYIKDRC